MKAVVRVINALFDVLPTGAKKFLLVYALIMAILAMIDLFALSAMAVALPGLIDSSSSVTIPLLGWEIDTFGEQVILIGVFAALISVKSVLNIIAIRIATNRFAKHELALGQDLFRAYMSANWVDRLKKSTPEIIRMVDSGVAATVAGALMPAASLIGDIVTVVVISFALVFFDWQTAIVTFVYLGLLALVLGRVIAPRALRNGRRNRTQSHEVVLLLQEAISALKEITLKGNERQVEGALGELRSPLSQVRADVQFYRQVPRFVLETGLVGGFIVIGGAGYLVGGQVGAVTSVALFGIAGFRLVPALTRIQSTQAQILTTSSFAYQVVDDIRFAEESMKRRHAADSEDLDAELRDITFQDVTYTYPNRDEPALRDVSLCIPAGSRIALVGTSGAGKSTFIDLLLGLLTPDTGSIQIGEQDSRAVLRQWRSRVGYVPQEVALFDLSVAHNVALTWNSDEIDEEQVRLALQRAQLLDIVEDRPDGIWGKIGERGMTLSGGQRQRLGIARGMYKTPSILVLDEATSALDTATEAAVTDEIRKLAGEVTTITVAHRLATIRDSDIVFYLAEGGLVTFGSFDEVVSSVPDFAYQATLAGIGDAKPSGPDDPESAGRAREGE